ncbi:trypsin-5-like [Achroia grisella]|uniref:trypsin-5-like n=1 Tax=Achroia grisella TaxID=688607 RepID=UPI0027D2BAB2|nr:trypsin-5-like [Achroia grisella]
MRLDSENLIPEGDEQVKITEVADVDVEDTSDQIGPTVTQIFHHPYSVSLLKNNSYVCSAIILNTYWLLTSSKCFDSNVISSYVTYKNLANFTVRVGSSYNNKGGSLYKIQMLINNFDMKVSCAKLETALVFGSRINSIRLPNPDEDVTLGYLASIIAWTPTGHIRSVNAPVIESSLCESFTKMLPGNYICIGGIQDPDRHFCRRDNGGAIVQNSTLVGISSFLRSCALYTKTHAFPKISSFSRWIDSVIWDEDNRPTSPSSTTNTQAILNNTETITQSTFFADPRKFMLTLPFDPVNVPLEPAEDNSVIPRMSLYESYLQNLAKSKTSTTTNPEQIEKAKREWLKHFSGAVMRMPQQIFANKYGTLDYK